MKIWILIIAILIAIFENSFIENIFAQAIHLFHTKSVFITAYYIIVTILGFLSIGLLFFVKQTRYFILGVLLLFLGYGIELIYKDINGVGFGLNELGIALNEANSFALSALVTYAGSIEKALIILFVTLVVVVLLRKVIVTKAIFVEKKYVLFISLLAWILGYSITYKTTGATQTRPTFFKIANTIIYYATNRLYYGERETLTQKPLLDAKYKNIILIVDESVGGKYLSINGYEKETTPYLKSIKEEFLNLGLASSGANCSAKSNIILMSGIQLNAFPDKENRALKRATIFQYAKNAGYKTHYISGQGIGSSLQNHMTKYDLQSIDNFAQAKERLEEKNMPEEFVIGATKEALKSADKNFIFIVKKGSHFQWEYTYPKEARYFLPTLEKTDALSLKLKENAINSYLNSIKYNVDLFFKYFLKSIEFFARDDTVIIYTSDHGQSILEEGRTATHCDSTNPPLSQGIVPLLLFVPQNDNLFKGKDFTINSYNHYQIFPTIQTLMGYKDIKAKTLFDKVALEPQQIFVSGDLFGRSSLQRNDIHLK